MVVQTMIVEIAESKDVTELVSLLLLLFSQEAEFAPNTLLQEQGLRQIINNPEIGHVIVARDKGRILGMVNLLYTVSTALGGKVGILEDMIVHPDFRGQHIGGDLLGEAIKHAREVGCLRITLLTDNDNIPAQRFYKRFGFELSTMVPMRLFLKTTLGKSLNSQP